MANLNLQDKKFITPENLKLIINYGLGFASRVKNLEDKEIAPFEADKLYTKDSLTIYDGYIYKAKVTNQSSTFNEIYWDLIGDDITELTKDDIKDMLGLTTEQLTTLSSIILDSEVRLDKTYSSSKIYSSIQDALDTAKAYTLSELGKMSGASYKIASSTSDMTDEKIIYLLQNNTTFDMYIVESGTPTKIGDTSIDLSDYYTKTEINNDFLKKADATLTYATKTELSEKANDDEVVKKDDIVTTIDSTSTDDTIPSAKTIYKNSVRIKDLSFSYTDTLTTLEEVILTIINNTNPQNFKSGVYSGRIISTHDGGGDLGTWNGNYILTVSHNNYYGTSGIVNTQGLSFNIHYTDGKWIVRKLCTTSVADVPKTAITWSDETNYKSSYTGCYYMVKNGICYVALDINIISESSKGVKLKDNSLPKSSFDYIHRSIPPHNSMGEALTLSVVNGVITLYNGTNGCRYLDSFSYPVAES